MTSIFILQSTGYCRGEARPFSTEEKATEALDWIMKHEGRPGNSWSIEEHRLDFLEPVDHPNCPREKLLPLSIVRIVREAEIPLNKCPRCGAETHCTDLCGGCRYASDRPGSMQAP